MRQGQQNKRMRGRGRKAPNSLNRVFESNGPDVKIRGTAAHIADKYQALSRDAQASGDRIASENYLQHAEHYLRTIAAAQAQVKPQQPQHQHGDADEFDDGTGEQPHLNGPVKDQDDDQPAQAAAENAPDDEQQQGARRRRRREPEGAGGNGGSDAIDAPAHADASEGDDGDSDDAPAQAAREQGEEASETAESAA